MSDEAFFVRGFGDLSASRGGIAWNLPGGSAGVMIEGGQASAVESDAVKDDSDERWSFYFPVEGDPLRSAATFRNIIVETADGVIVCTAHGPEGASGHGEESSSGVLRAAGEELPFEETLISTQYDGDGNPTRFGLELWPEGADQSSRAAATRATGSLLEGIANGQTWAGLFRCHTNGFDGHASYLLWRA
jgi:hypothetical protein